MKGLARFDAVPRVAVGRAEFDCIAPVFMAAIITGQLLDMYEVTLVVPLSDILCPFLLSCRARALKPNLASQLINAFSAVSVPGPSRVDAWRRLGKAQLRHEAFSRRLLQPEGCVHSQWGTPLYPSAKEMLSADWQGPTWTTLTQRFYNSAHAIAIQPRSSVGDGHRRLL